MIRMTTVSGTHVDLENPDTSQIRIDDIATGLSNIVRFAGQMRQRYTVAHHAVLVATLVEPRFRYPALHHDDSEAYLGDLSSGLKRAPGMAYYRMLEERWQQAIGWRLGFDPSYNSQIHVADHLVAVWERLVLRWGQVWPQTDGGVTAVIHQAISDRFVSDQPGELFHASRRLAVGTFWRFANDPDPKSLYLRSHRRLAREHIELEIA